MARAYRPTAKILHWVTALLVLGMIPVGLAMTGDDLPRNVQDSLFIFHKNFGVTVLVLVLLRLVYRAFNPAPPLPASVPGWQRTIAALTHWGLYAALLVMAVSGYVRVRAGGFPIEGLDALGLSSFLPRSDDLAETASDIHDFTKVPLIALILAHVGAALYHAVVLRDGVFSRMWFRRRR